jgi:L,D-peptidoglycan transpeptidase YkuD (ErfK/YbiS/YcfS/YnhG family)
MLAVTASAAGGERAEAACSANLASRLTTGSAQQLVTVVAPHASSTQGSLQLWRKTGGCWRTLAGPWTAWVGQHGVSTHKREGDRTTPAGAFGFLPVMYGIEANPGVHYRYHRIV